MEERGLAIIINLLRFIETQLQVELNRSELSDEDYKRLNKCYIDLINYGRQVEEARGRLLSPALKGKVISWKDNGT